MNLKKFNTTFKDHKIPYSCIYLFFFFTRFYRLKIDHEDLKVALQLPHDSPTMFPPLSLSWKEGLEFIAYWIKITRRVRRMHVQFYKKTETNIFRFNPPTKKKCNIYSAVSGLSVCTSFAWIETKSHVYILI